MIYLAYYLVLVPLLIMLFIPGNRAPRWLFWSTIATAAAGVCLAVFIASGGTW